VQSLTKYQTLQTWGKCEKWKTSEVQFYNEASTQGIDQACGKESSTHKNDPCGT
jgi:hypothetical protein